jgi:hypothetical protein
MIDIIAGQTHSRMGPSLRFRQVGISLVGRARAPVGAQAPESVSRYSFEGSTTLSDPLGGEPVDSDGPTIASLAGQPWSEGAQLKERRNSADSFGEPTH